MCTISYLNKHLLCLSIWYQVFKEVRTDLYKSHHGLVETQTIASATSSPPTLTNQPQASTESPSGDSQPLQRQDGDSLVAGAGRAESEAAKLTTLRGGGLSGVASTVDLDVLDEEVQFMDIAGSILSSGGNCFVLRVNVSQVAKLALS